MTRRQTCRDFMLASTKKNAQPTTPNKQPKRECIPYRRTTAHAVPEFLCWEVRGFKISYTLYTWNMQCAVLRSYLPVRRGPCLAVWYQIGFKLRWLFKLSALYMYWIDHSQYFHHYHWIKYSKGTAREQRKNNRGGGRWWNKKSRACTKRK
jgi:hypothetical protein